MFDHGGEVSNLLSSSCSFCLEQGGREGERDIRGQERDQSNNLWLSGRNKINPLLDVNLDGENQ